jgi:hypothetical protein
MALVINYDPSVSTFDRPVGLQQAVVASVIDLGERPDVFNEGKMKHQIALTWQLGTTYKNKEGKVLPLQQTEIYTLSLHEKAKLRGILEGILGKNFGAGVIQFDVESIVGMHCMLTIKKKDDEKGFTTVVATAPLMMGMKPLEIVALPVPQWIIDMRDKKTPVDPSSKMMTDEEIKAIVGKI